MRGYPEYKDSGVEWAKNIPAHWNEKKLKHVSICLDEKRIPLNAKERGEMTGDIPYWGANGIVDHVSSWIFDEELVLVGEDGAPFFDKNKDVAFNVSGKVWVNNHAHILRPIKPLINIKFLKYALNTVSYELYINGSTRDKLTQFELNNIRLAYPPVKEQNQVANYLDRETARIDKLITEKQNFIKLLKEKRQALISHVVTKGLDPDVKVKESGIEWIGEVPEHWGLKPLKHIVLTRKGAAFKSNYFCDEGVSVIKASDIKNKTLRTSGIFLPSEFKKLFPKALIYHKEIILSTVGSLPEVKNSAVGQIGFVPKHLNGSLLNQNTVVFTALQQYIFPEYLLLLLQLPSYREHLDLNAHGTANQASLNIIDMLNFSFYLPTTTEQKLLVDTLSVSLKSLEELKNETLNSIDLLKEHRTALISAAVTGKIDVRDQAKESAT